MAIEKFSKNMAIIAALDDEPNDVGGMTSAELKDKFDEGGKALQTYLNDTLIPSLENLGVEQAALLPSNSAGFKYIRLNSDKVLEVSADGKTWQASSGHLILDASGNQLPQRSRMQFDNCDVTDSGNVTVVHGVKGDKGDKGDQGNTGAQGVQGVKGDRGQVFVPSINDDGQISWTIQEPTTTVPASRNIRGPQGIQGVQGIQGPEGSQGPRGYPANVNGKTPDDSGAITLTAADVGAAPAGYGLGTRFAAANTIADANAATVIGWYRVGSGTANYNRGYGDMLVDAIANNQILQTVYQAEGNILQRRCISGTWDDDWAYVNPPLAAGVEYRTVERWNGAPVYAMSVQYKFTQTYTDSFSLEIPHGIEYFGNLIKAEIVQPPYSYPYVDSRGGMAGVKYVNATNIVFDSYKVGFRTGNILNFVLHYTKTT